MNILIANQHEISFFKQNTHPAHLIVAHRLEYLCLCVHHKGSTCYHWFLERAALQQEDLRDLTKILVVLLLIIFGYFLVAPERDAAAEIRVAASARAPA